VPRVEPEQDGHLSHMPALDLRLPTAVPPDAVTEPAAKIIHHLGLAGMLGGQLFGRLALHPAVAEISDPRERGEVVNAAWKRYGVVNGISLLAVAGAHAASRAQADGHGRLAPATKRERALARVQDGLLGATVATGVATAIAGVRFAHQAPEGRVPLEDGDHTAPQATKTQRRTKRLLNKLGTAAIACEAGLVAVNAALEAEQERSSVRRRLLRRG
jgi:uncharacterized membrane protein